jgi:hypothetical protein
MKNPAHLRSWIRQYGALGYFMAGFILVAHELLVIRRRRTLMVSVGFCLLMCLVGVTAIRLRRSNAASSYVLTAAHNTQPSLATHVLKTREYSLTRLVTGVSWQDRTRSPRKDETWASVVGFRIVEQGQPAPWEPVGIAVTDGKGKKWNWAGGGCEHEGEEALFLFLLDPVEGQLGRNETRPDNTQWKLRVEFSQKRDFALADLWTVRNVPVPKKGQKVDFRTFASTVLHGMKVELGQIVPPGESIGETVEQWDRKTPAVSVTLSPKREGIRLDLVKATDGQGRAVNTSFLMSGSGGDCIGIPDPTYRYHYSLDGVRSDVKTINLTFALHESEYAEFTAKPTIMAK